MRRAWLILPVVLACGEPPAPPPSLRVSSAVLDFGQIPVGRNHTRRLTVTNDGPGQLSITAVRIDREQFEVFPSTALLNAGMEAELRVRFTPDRPGRFESSMTFDSNATSSTGAVALVGSGVCSGVGCPSDAGVPPDAGTVDAAPADAEADAGVAGPDAAEPDAGEPEDASPPDSGVDAGVAGLAANYRFEETGGALLDDSGNGNHGVPSAAGLLRGVPGRIGNAVEFEGNVGQFVVPADPTLDAAGALSFELWINTSNIGVSQSILGRGLNTGGDGVFLSTQCNNIYVAFSRSGVAGTANATTNCNAFSDGEWVHVAVVNDGLFLTVYLDGQRVAETIGGYLGPIASPLYLGRREPGVEPFAGRMDELSWWTIPRSHAEICGSAGGTFAGGSCSR